MARSKSSIPFPIARNRPGIWKVRTAPTVHIMRKTVLEVPVFPKDTSSRIPKVA